MGDQILVDELRIDHQFNYPENYKICHIKGGKNGQIGLSLKYDLQDSINRLKIVNITPAGPAFKAGVCFNDQIIQINGIPVASLSPDDWIDVCNNYSNGSTKNLVLTLIPGQDETLFHKIVNFLLQKTWLQ